MPSARPSEAPALRLIAGRYEVQELLARGGMACVYRVRDSATGAAFALKWLTDSTNKASRELFEREYHTLMQLAHPRVVQAYEYGLDDDNPYYTMELLDGGDLRELAPLPWQEVCRIAYDVCSALSLLHSRRLIHLDVTPRNIRRTADGTAKLIDFGLLAPMGPRGFLAGTPAFIAPEVIGNLSLDGRADLFSLGATLYHALTGRSAYPVQRMQQLQDAWRSNPAAPSRLVKDLPPALDRLVLSLIRLDAGSRPKSAAEVMEHLLPLLGSPPSELLSVTHAYLTTPQLVGREELIKLFRRQMVRSLRQRGGGFLISGKAGIGRSRVLDSFVLEAKLIGAVSLRARAADGLGLRFGVAQVLAQQLLDAFPEETAQVIAAGGEAALLFERSETETSAPKLIDIAGAAHGRTAIHGALCAWMLQLARYRALAIAVDDLHQVDDASAALIASLASEAHDLPLVYAVTLDADAQVPARDALAVLRSRAEPIELPPLDRDQINSLLGSVFGDVTNLQLLSSRLHPLCGGRPRDCMLLASQLVDAGVITYADGAWSLPEAYDEGQLPASIEEVLDRKAAQLSPQARTLAGLLSLGLLRRLSRSQLLLRAGASGHATDRALDELLGALLVIGDHAGYALCHDGFALRVQALFGPDERKALHAQLAQIYQRSGQQPLVVAHHWLCAGEPARGLQLLPALGPDASGWEAALDQALSQLSVEQVAITLQLALNEAERAARPASELLSLRERLAHMSTLGDDPDYYYNVAPACLAQYQKDSGYDFWLTLDPTLPAKQRTEQALIHAFERHNALPEAERVLSPIDAIKALVRWVAISLPVGSRIFDLDLVGSLPALLEPFAPLDPLVDAMARNALATRYFRCEGRLQDARRLWIEVLTELEAGSGANVAYMTRVRTAVCFALGATDALLGIPSSWADRIEQGEHDAMQLAQVYYVRKMAALSQGDWEAAEQHRRRAELLKLRTKMYTSISTLLMELVVHVAARDLTGLKQVRSGIQSMADKYPGWLATRHLADAHLARLRGDFGVALRAIDATIEESETQQANWLGLPTARATRVEILSELGRLEQAATEGIPLLDRYRSGGAHHTARELSRTLALIDAKLGHFEAAMSRASAVIEEQLELGVRGLQLGLSYETCARIAICARDGGAFTTYAALTAECYLAGHGTLLSALYERLQEDARAAGLLEARVSLRHSEMVSWRPSDSTWLSHRLETAMAGHDTTEQRALVALRLLCEARNLRGGHLFLLNGEQLALAASDIAPAGLSDALSFASGYLTSEVERIRAEALLARSGVDVSEVRSTVQEAEWFGPDGARCRALLMSGIAQGRVTVAGVALLAECNEPTSHLASLASTLTARLVREGDVSGAIVV